VFVLHEELVLGMHGICLTEHTVTCFFNFPSIDLHAGVKFWMFLTSNEGVKLYVDQLIHEYTRHTVHVFSLKIGLAPGK